MKSTVIATLALMASLAMAQNVAQTYSIVDLGTVGGAPGSPYSIANNGLVAGAAIGVDNRSHGEVWLLGLKFDMGAALGGLNSFANSVNGKGQVVGAAETTDINNADFCGFGAYGVVPSFRACLPYVFQDGVMTKLPTLGGPNGVANMINSGGEAVGWAESTQRDPNAACASNQFQPVAWGKSGVTKLPTFPGDPDGVAAAVNDRGQIVGATGTCGAFSTDARLQLVERHAMLWEGGAAISLGSLGGSGGFAGHHACAVNNPGQVVGHSDLPGDTTFHTFLWSWETGMRDLGVLSGDFASTAIAVNDRGVAVGTSLDSQFNPRAFVWQDGAMTDLNAVASSNPRKLYLLLANSINGSGEIVGLAVTADGNLHGFLATPDSNGMSLSVHESTARAVLSSDARATVFRVIGIRRK